MTVVTDIQQNGFSNPHSVWPGIAAYTDYLKSCHAYNGHVQASGDGVERTLDDALSQTTGLNCGYACNSLEDVLRGPGLLDFMVPMTELAAEYFGGEDPLLYSVNAFWKKSFSDADWHADQDDRKIFVMFMYGTDIQTKLDGPHSYVRGSHLLPKETIEAIHRNNIPPDHRLVETFYGPAGTYFFTDTQGLHKGHAPKWNPRLLIWARSGVSDPPQSYIGDKLRPVPASKLQTANMPDEQTCRRLKLVIDWNA